MGDAHRHGQRARTAGDTGGQDHDRTNTTVSGTHGTARTGSESIGTGTGTTTGAHVTGNPGRRETQMTTDTTGYDTLTAGCDACEDRHPMQVMTPLEYRAADGTRAIAMVCPMCAPQDGD